MKSILLSIILLGGVLLQAQSKERKLVWADEFNRPELNQNFWTFKLGDGCPDLCGWGNNERQIYTDSNHVIRDGNLVIQARLKGGVYTSSRITTENQIQYTYGRFEVRAKLPVGQGVWPAFWMLGSNINEVGWPLCGEIDILEYVGKEPHEVFTSLHTKASHGETINTKKTKFPKIEEGFHVDTADWDENQIEFFTTEQIHLQNEVARHDLKIKKISERLKEINESDARLLELKRLDKELIFKKK